MIICPTVEVRKKGTAEWRLAFCLLGSSHRPDWGSQSWINLRLMVCRLPLLRWWKQEVIQSQVAPVYPYAAQTHVHLSHENLFSESQNPWKSQWVPQGSSEELTQDPGVEEPQLGARALWYLCNTISLSITIKLFSLVPFWVKIKGQLKFIQSYFVVRAKYLNETNEVVFFIFFTHFWLFF